MLPPKRCRLRRDFLMEIDEKPTTKWPSGPISAILCVLYRADGLKRRFQLRVRRRPLDTLQALGVAEHMGNVGR